MLRSSAASRRSPRLAGLALATGGALVLLAAQLPVAGAAPASPDGTASVQRVPGGYRVSLRLSTALPARDALPELAVGGRSLGTATESADGRTLTVQTADPAAARAGQVRVAWNGEVPATSAPTRLSADQVRRLTAVPQATGPLVKDDPAAAGNYGVRRADYDFGDSAVTLPGLGGRVSEVRAAVFLPVGATGRRPVVLFLHGRHASCYDPVAVVSTNAVWPCPAGYQPVPSYLGYNGSAQALASRGYVVVSISADAVNAQDNPYSDDAGTLARGQLVLDHLDLLAAADAGRVPAMNTLKARLDLTHVGLMGHSRGGEGVVKAALLNAARPKRYGIQAVLPLAPIDFGRETLPDVPVAVLLPYCDGDVANQQGQHFYDDSRYADDRGTDGVARSSLMIMGANHNYFNSEWTPGLAAAPANDDWSDAADPTCSPNAPTTTRLTVAQQYQVGVAYVTGFFRLTMGGETRFRPLFDGSQGRATSVGAASVLTEAQSASGSRFDVAPLDAPRPGVRFAGAGAATYCASIGVGRSPSSPLPPCSVSKMTSRFPSFTPANYAANVPATPLLHLTWTVPTVEGAPPAAVRVDLPAGRRDISRYAGLTLRASRDDVTTDTPVEASDLTLSVVDGRGRTASASLSSLGDALAVLPGTGTRLLPKVWLRTVAWPVARMRGVDTRDIRQVRIAAASPTGGVYLSDIAFQSASVGAGGPSDLPQVSITGATMDEGDGPDTVPVTVRLSRPSTLPVTVQVQSVAAVGGQIEAQAQPVVLAPGARSATVQVPLVGDTTPAATPDTVYKVFVSVPTNAVVGKNSGRIVVRDDDGPAPAAPAPTS